LGRIDEQVKIRGFRIELGEIENHLMRFSGITRCAVIALEMGGDRYLVAYYVASYEIAEAALRYHLSETLPDYMIPSYFVKLDELPITTNGKVDSKRLPIDFRRSKVEVFVGNEIEEKILDIWSEVLSADRNSIGLHTNFFEIGGHSINLIRVNHRINEMFNLDIPVVIMFRLPTIAMIAHYIEQGDSTVDMLSGHIDQSVKEAEENLRILNQLND
jgi:acyl carrier protein